MASLTAKQQRFVHHYCDADCPDATEAAVRAGYAKTYANRQAYQLLDNPRLIPAIAEEKERLSALSPISDEELYGILADRARDASRAPDQLRAIELLMKSRGMLKDVQHQTVKHDHATMMEEINARIKNAEECSNECSTDNVVKLTA